MANRKKYWAALDELEGTEVFQQLQKKEFQEQIPVEEFLADERHGADAEVGQGDGRALTYVVTKVRIKSHVLGVTTPPPKACFSPLAPSRADTPRGGAGCRRTP